MPKLITFQVCNDISSDPIILLSRTLEGLEVNQVIERRVLLKERRTGLGSSSERDVVIFLERTAINVVTNVFPKVGVLE